MPPVNSAINLRKMFDFNKLNKNCELNNIKKILSELNILYKIYLMNKLRKKYGYLFLLFDATTLKMARKPVKLKKENPTGCAGEGGLKDNRQ